MKFYQASRQFARFWRICMIVVMLFLYAVPASAETDNIIIRSPDIGEEVANLFIIEGIPRGQVSYTLTDPDRNIVAEGVVQNDDPEQLVITLADTPRYVTGIYTFAFAVGGTRSVLQKSAYTPNKKQMQFSGGSTSDLLRVSFGVTVYPYGCRRSFLK